MTPYLVVAGFLFLAALLLINSFKLTNARIRIMDLEQAYPERKQALLQRQNELAYVRALRNKAHETELFARLSLEMGLPITGEDDDTLPLVGDLP